MSSSGHTSPISPSVQEGLRFIETRRSSKRSRWGFGLSILNETTQRLPLVIRKALAIKKVLAEMPLSIRKHELIVGISVHANILKKPELPEYATEAELTRAAERMTHPGSIFGHSSPAYGKFLRLGFCGLLDLVNNKRNKAVENGATAADLVWYDSLKISVEAVRLLAGRYQELARQLAHRECEKKRKNELEEIADVLAFLIDNPPATFRQALQAVWLSHISFTSTMNFLPLGRMDQYLWPFLREDLKNGATTLEDAQELIDLFWIKCNDLLEDVRLQDYQGNPETPVPFDEFVRGIGHKSLYLGGRTTLDRMVLGRGTSQQFLQTVTLSGYTPDGSDGTNSLTYLCLNATRRLGVPQPCLYVRLHGDSPSELLSRISDTIRAGCVGPTIYNDDVLVPAFESLGIEKAHARDYTSDGCWEPHLQGRTYFKHAWVSLAEVLDRVLQPERWRSVAVPMYREDMDPFREYEPSDPSSYAVFDELMGAVKDTLERYIRGFIEVREQFEDGRLYDIAPLPLLSAFSEGPLERGKDITRGGFLYNFHMPELSGLSHVADSLAVLKKLCFTDKSLPLSELLDAIRNNWQNREPLRLWVQTRIPAYGNDVDYVDEIAAELVEHYIGCIRKYGKNQKSSIYYLSGIATYENYPELGHFVGATPDGRRSGEPLSSNASPSIGRAISGQTAAVNSYLKLPLEKLTGGSILDLSIETKSGLLAHLVSFVRTFIQDGGNILSIAINDSEKLRKAQKNPENYRDLKVRVGGYDAYFVDLPPEHQELQIRRIEQYR